MFLPSSIWFLFLSKAVQTLENCGQRKIPLLDLFRNYHAAFYESSYILFIFSFGIRGPEKLFTLLRTKEYLWSNTCINIVLNTENNSVSYDEGSQSSPDEEYLKDLPQKLQSHVQTGDFALKELEQYGQTLQGENDKYQSHLLFYLSFLIVVFALLIFVYFLYFGLFIYTVIGVLFSLLVELLFLLRSKTFNFVTPTVGKNWKNFRKLFLYDLGNVNPFFRMITKRSEHERLISQFRRKSVYVLRRFGLLEIPDVERAVEFFESNSDDERTMIDELTKEFEKLGINKDIFELFYYEFPLPNNGEKLQEIKDKNDEFQLLLKTLIGNGTIRIDLDNHFDLDILSYTLKSVDNFSLDEVRIRLTDQRMETRKLERNIRRLIEIYFPNRVIQNINDGITFTGVSSLKDSYIKRLSEVYKVDSEVLWYLFHSIEPSTEGEVFIEKFKDNEEFLENLCKFLMDEGVVRSRSTPLELAEILKAVPRLSPEALQIKIYDYEDALSFTKEFRGFIERTGAIHRNTSLKINAIFELCNHVTDRIDRLFQLASKIIEEFEIDRSPSLSLSTKAKEATSESFLAIYLYRKQSPLLESICNRISSHQNSVGILYDHAVLSDREGTSSEDLDKLILVAISRYDQNKTVNDRYYLQFKEKLGEGILYTNIKRLDSYVIAEIRDRLGEIGSKISDVSSLSVFKQSLKELLDDTLIGSKIGSLLDYGTVGAFLLTKDPKSEGNVLPLVDEISANNDIMLYTGSGDHTRFGMIPFGTTFEEFSEYFESLYKREASKPGNQDILSSTTLNIYKFVPSKSFTKIIGISSESAVVDVIGKFIRADKFPASDKISILASLTGESDSRRSVGHIIIEAIDGINIIEFAIEKAGLEKFSLSVLSKVPLDSRVTFNRDLLHHFSVETVSTLSKSIYKGAINNKDRIFQKFGNGVFRALNRSKLTNELRNDIEFLFDKLKALGYVLDTI